MYIRCFFGATAWEWQIGPIYGGFRYPSYWLYSKARRDFRKANPGHFLAKGRAWFYNWPLYIRYDESWSKSND